MPHIIPLGRNVAKGSIWIEQPDLSLGSTISSAVPVMRLASDSFD